MSDKDSMEKRRRSTFFKSLARAWPLALSSMILMGLVSCSSSTRFEDKNHQGPSPVVESIKREIASESPLSKGCHEIVEEIFYIREQEKIKKKKPKN